MPEWLQLTLSALLASLQCLLCFVLPIAYMIGISIWGYRRRR